MHSIKVILRTQKKKANGEIPLVLRVTIDRKSALQSLGYNVLPEHWDGDKVKKSHPNYKEINSVITSEINKAQKKIAIQSTADKPVNIDLFAKGKTTSFIKYVENRMHNLHKEPGTVRNYNKHLNKIKAYSPGLTFPGITSKYLNDLQQYLKDEGLSDNSIWDVFKFMKKFWNLAIKEEVTTGNPFGKMGEQPKYKNIAPEYLIIEELDKLHALLEQDLPVKIRLFINYFLLECYCGLRFSDWKRFKIEKLIKEESIKAITKKNNQPVYFNFKDSPRLSFVIDNLKDLPPFDYTLEDVNRCLKNIAIMAGIQKNLRTHIARHTFGVLCANLGISIEVTAAFMGITTRVCDVYYKITRVRTNEEFKKWGNI